jgi:hypothetical protein
MADIVLIKDGHEIPLARLDTTRGCTLSLIDELARLQLVARAGGWTVVLDEPVPALVELIDQAGLSAVLPVRRGIDHR